MKTNIACIECSLHNFLRLMADFDIPQDRQQTMTREFLTYLATIDYALSPPAIARHTYARIGQFLDCADPYASQKQEQNRSAMQIYHAMVPRVAASGNPPLSALKLAIAGNAIDLGPSKRLDADAIIDQALETPLAIDDASFFFKALRNCRHLLYLTDNAGEIVFDRLFIETLIDHGLIDSKRLTVATRGYPVINDATPADAHVVGLDRVVRVIDNGDRSPGTLLQYTSDAFRRVFQKCDLVVSKGQGNFETLNDMGAKHIYFFLVAKCPVIAKALNTTVGAFVCKHHFQDAATSLL